MNLFLQNFGKFLNNKLKANGKRLSVVGVKVKWAMPELGYGNPL